MILDGTSEPVSQPQLNAVLTRVALVMVSLHSSKTLTETVIKQLNLAKDTYGFAIGPFFELEKTIYSGQEDATICKSKFYLAGN